jgi:hypothetical protein
MPGSAASCSFVALFRSNRSAALEVGAAALAPAVVVGGFDAGGDAAALDCAQAAPTVVHATAAAMRTALEIRRMMQLLSS